VDFHRRVDAVRDAARGWPPGAGEEIQDELGLILHFCAIERACDAALLDNIELAVTSLLLNPPNRLLAAVAKSCRTPRGLPAPAGRGRVAGGGGVRSFATAPCGSGSHRTAGGKDRQQRGACGASEHGRLTSRIDGIAAEAEEPTP